MALDPVYNISNFVQGGADAYGISLNSNGDLFLAENFGTIRKVDKSGFVSTPVAGIGVSGVSSGNGGLATSAMLGYPSDVAVSKNGELIIVEYGMHLVRKVLVNQIITAFAGVLGTSGSSGDGGLATAASLFYPNGAAVSSVGDVYISDTLNNKIRIVYSNGTISTFAGSGGLEFSGEGGLAINANFESPKLMAIGPNDDLYMAAQGANRICKVSNGILTTIAGNGIAGYSGDGGLAINAQLFAPTGVALGPHGEVYITDSDNYVIRKVSPNGIISTIAGKAGDFGYSGDGGLATNAQLSKPYGIAVDSNGTVYFSDGINSRVRKLVPHCTFGTLVNGTCEFSCFGTINTDPSVCSGNGKCASPNLCECHSGWKGNNNCSMFSCDALNECSDNGSCISNNTCLCNAGWKLNSACSEYSCEMRNNCSGERGVCSGSNTCSCHAGYFGSDCQYYSCFDQTIVGNQNSGVRLSMAERFCLKINKQLLHG